LKVFLIFVGFLLWLIFGIVFSLIGFTLIGTTKITYWLDSKEKPFYLFRRSEEVDHSACFKGVRYLLILISLVLASPVGGCLIFFGVAVSIMLYMKEQTCPYKKAPKMVISKVIPYEVEMSPRGNLTSNLNLVNSVDN
jgi:hypothetical protein